MLGSARSEAEPLLGTARSEAETVLGTARSEAEIVLVPGYRRGRLKGSRRAQAAADLLLMAQAEAMRRGDGAERGGAAGRGRQGGRRGRVGASSVRRRRRAGCAPSRPSREPASRKPRVQSPRSEPSSR